MENTNTQIGQNLFNELDSEIVDHIEAIEGDRHNVNIFINEDAELVIESMFQFCSQLEDRIENFLIEAGFEIGIE